MVTEKDYALYGTKVLNLKTQEISLLICIWKNKFAKEIRTAFESYRRTQLNKYSYNFKDDNSMEYNFYFQLQWNFNHFGNSNWYIEKM